MKKIIPIVVLMTAAQAFAQTAEAPLRNVQFNGWGFVRNEQKNDADYKTSAKDKTEATQTRINVSVKADLAENYGYVFLAPQFSKISGLDEVITPSSTAVQTSGGLTDSRLDVHEAYFAIKPTKDESLYVFAGRQELAYGDHLILGSVPWHRIGRSFDGLKARYKYSDMLTIDGFAAKLQENNAPTATPNGNDSNLRGIYGVGSLGNSIKQADFYVLKKDNKKDGAFNAFRDTSAYGVRFKSAIGETGFDYRAEGTLEQTKLAGDTTSQNSEYQVDLELGYALPVLSSRVAFEYFDSTKNFDQLFPTAHKFLGYADQFSRRNIKGYVGHLSFKPYDKFTFFADYHIFQRHSTSNGAYNFTGTSLGTTGTSKDIANELDLILAYDFTKTLQLSYGYSLVNPGKYLKDQSSEVNSATQWSYLQLLVRF